MERGDLTYPNSEKRQEFPEELIKRIGEQALQHRLEKQALQESKQVFQRKNLMNPDRIPFFFETVRFVFKALGLYQRGHREFLDVHNYQYDIFGCYYSNRWITYDLWMGIFDFGHQEG